MKNSILLLKKFNILPQRIFRVPSKSEKGKYHFVRVWKNRIECDCIAYMMHQNCRHIKLALKHLQNEKIKTNN